MLGLQQTDTPIVGIISRLTVQKGIHLIKHAIYRTLERNGQVLSLAQGYYLQVCYATFTLFTFSETEAFYFSITGGSAGFSTRSSHSR
jgi:hypothetical protein